MRIITGINEKDTLYLKETGDDILTGFARAFSRHCNAHTGNGRPNLCLSISWLWLKGGTRSAPQEARNFLNDFTGKKEESSERMVYEFPTNMNVPD